MSEPTNVAIACQGGGSHTAFTAGVLQGLFDDWDDDYELVAISGTSGGALSAATAWYAMLTEDRATAIERLGGLWDDLAARTPFDRAVNDWTVWWSWLHTTGLPVPEVSPYSVPGSAAGKRRLRRVMEQYIDFDTLPELCRYENPTLVVGTVDVNGGRFETFVDEAVTADAILASAAVPDLFEAVEIHGHYHWDGLFSQNPPIHDLMSGPVERKPDELWVIQINPQTREGEPRTVEEIADRRNELSGNISMNQELRFIETVNDWVAAGHLPADQFTHTEIRRIEMDEEFYYSTKVDRRGEFVDDLLAAGRRRAATFLSDA
jgi:NTE family protein